MKYSELRKIDVTNHIEKKGQFSYLSWTYAVDTLLQNDPAASWYFKDNLTLPDGSMMVFCVLNAFGKETHMQLPVLDYKNNAIKNPTAMHLNTAMMRCLAKAIACTGIGLHIYAGEDLPPNDDSQDTDKQEKKPKEEVNPEGLSDDELNLILKHFNDAQNKEQLDDAKDKARAAWKRMSKNQQTMVTSVISRTENEVGV